MDQQWRRLAADLRRSGMTYHDIARVLAHRAGTNPRVAFRWAHGWSQMDAARAWSKLFPGETKDPKRFSSWEAWPNGGSPPSWRNLDQLAQLYQCSARDLIADVSDHAGLDTAANPAAPPDGAAAESAAYVEDLAHTIERIRWLRAPNLDAETLDHLAGLLDEYSRVYEHAGATLLYPPAARQHHIIGELLRGHQPPGLRAELIVLASRYAVLVGHLAFDLGQDNLASVYLTEAWTLAELAGHHTLLAHIRGSQSFIAYYQQRYRESLRLACDGTQYANSGPEAIRLAVQQARAHARLGNEADVDRAVEQAFDLRGRLTEPDIPAAFLSGAPLDTSRIAGNAATAYLSFGAGEKVRRYGTLALPVLEAHNAHAGVALTKLDIAAAYLVDQTPDPDHAAAVAEDAVRHAHALRSNVLAQRATEFALRAGPWRNRPAMAAATEALAAWRHNPPPAAAGQPPP